MSFLFRKWFAFFFKFFSIYPFLPFFPIIFIRFSRAYLHIKSSVTVFNIILHLQFYFFQDLFRENFRRSIGTNNKSYKSYFFSNQIIFSKEFWAFLYSHSTANTQILTDICLGISFKSISILIFWVSSLKILRAYDTCNPLLEVSSKLALTEFKTSELPLVDQTHFRFIHVKHVFGKLDARYDVWLRNMGINIIT